MSYIKSDILAYINSAIGRLETLLISLWGAVMCSNIYPLRSL